MQFLRILFWCLIAFVAALFTYGNWTPVTIQLWSGLEALVKLPFLLMIAFFAGLLPTLAWNHAVRWRLRQRLAAAEQDAAQARHAASLSEPPAASATTGPVLAKASPAAAPPAAATPALDIPPEPA